MTLGTVAVILVTAFAEIIRRVLSASKVRGVDFPAAGQNEMAQIIMIMRFIVMPALGGEAKDLLRRTVPRNDPSCIRKIKAGSTPLLRNPGLPCPD
ncbi:hypothetical protein D3C73_589190 [compost metagenome]